MITLSETSISIYSIYSIKTSSTIVIGVIESYCFHIVESNQVSVEIARIEK